MNSRLLCGRDQRDDLYEYVLVSGDSLWFMYAEMLKKRAPCSAFYFLLLPPSRLLAARAGARLPSCSSNYRIMCAFPFTVFVPLTLDCFADSYNLFGSVEK